MKTSSERNFIGDISTRYLWSFSSIDKFFTKNPTYIIDSKMFVSYLQFYKNNLYTYKTLVTLIVCLFVCLFETVRTNPGYGMATLIYNNLLNLISGTVILLRSS